MKSVETVKNSIIAKKGYYYKREEIPDAEISDVDFILKAETMEVIEDVKKSVKTIENCVLFFTVLQVLSIVASIILFIIMLKGF